MENQFTDFLSKTNPETLIIYGLVNEPARVLAELDQHKGSIVFLTNRYALLASNINALRLSSSGWINITFEQRGTLACPRDLFLFCRRKILGRVSQFAKPIRQFLDAYLDFVWYQTEIFKDELEECLLNPEVYGPQDWVFSAFLPLPNAFILLPSEFERGSPQFAEVDIIFWLNGRIKAVVIEGMGTPIKSRQRRLDYLCENHPYLDLISVSRDGISNGRFPTDAFSVPFNHYWRGLTLPMGPAPPII